MTEFTTTFKKPDLGGAADASADHAKKQIARSDSETLGGDNMREHLRRSGCRRSRRLFNVVRLAVAAVVVFIVIGCGPDDPVGAPVTPVPTNPVTITDVTIQPCDSNGDREIVVSAAGGLQPAGTAALYTWIRDATAFATNAISPQSFTMQGGQSSTVKVEAADSSDFAAVTTDPCGVTVAISPSPFTCQANLFEFTVTASGGTAPYSLSIDNVTDGGVEQSSFTRTRPANGKTYTVLVLDANGNPSGIVNLTAPNCPGLVVSVACDANGATTVVIEWEGATSGQLVNWNVDNAQTYSQQSPLTITLTPDGKSHKVEAQSPTGDRIPRSYQFDPPRQSYLYLGHQRRHTTLHLDRRWNHGSRHDKPVDTPGERSRPNGHRHRY